MEVSRQPYLKQYSFPFFSMTTLVRLTALTIAVALPFFLAYATPIYQHQYYIRITTDTAQYTYCNFYSVYSSKGLTLQESDHGDVLELELEWQKESTAQKVRGVEILLGFEFQANSTMQYGVVKGEVEGYNIAQANLVGYMTIQQGTGNNTTASNNLPLNNYDLYRTIQQSHQSANYLSYSYSTLPINLPSDQLSLALTLNYGSRPTSQETPTLLGQLVWSWVQYLPLFLGVYWAVDLTMGFLLREKVLKRRLIHDQEYLGVVAGENGRRSKLRVG